VNSRFSKPEEITPEHLVDAFDCGSVSQTMWLRQRAVQSHQSHDNVVFVVRRLDDDKVVGYYALRTGGILQQDAPARLKKGAGGYPEIGVVILTRLGVDISEQNCGLGRSLLQNALLRVDRLAEQVGFRALLIHAETDEAREWYLRQAAFDASPIDPNQLVLVLKDLRKAIAG
jgi:Acetyltransferase (GNAT) family